MNAPKPSLDEIEEMRERNRLDYLAQLEQNNPQQDDYRGSDGLTGRSRIAKERIRQTLAESERRRLHTIKETP